MSYLEEICHGKEAFSTWKIARKVLKNMRNRFLDRKSTLTIYRCPVDKTHFHIGSEIAKPKHLEMPYAEDDEEGN
jgi:hypothetical protein